ncbi:hypothetical protein ACFWDG_02715 [Peribacillus sp. NPDC060186]|uniref:hypothetical protein n=1 Tax=Peribacillus TaxID=2675229 RepID=UPI000A97434D|nr:MULTISPECIES: hypothetical protein [Peribacillus]MBK5443468.1 hypothetical protein [Peribacillus sp. TH24]MBK5461800.1 hypothetical protein [Peribacillus sp. TH27]MBK5499952.1 hypothetical protein [Peribacillus sp. TH14]MCO0597030.1 hypothetical protein [Peribacillus butanolivorans]WMX54997.1 hypothetical protein RE409_23580 [Peribacillus sp. R9-11]
MDNSDSKKVEQNNKNKQSSKVGSLEYTTEQLMNGMNGIQEAYLTNMDDDDEKETPNK